MHEERLAEAANPIAAVKRIDALPTMLRVLCEITGMGFAVVARVTEDSWTACAVHDDIRFGIEVAAQFDVSTTLCRDVRASRIPISIEHASADSRYAEHPAPKRYGFESYVSVPIILANGDYFGNLCALDPRPAAVADPRIELLFSCFAQMIAARLVKRAPRPLGPGAPSDRRVVANLRGLIIALLTSDLPETADSSRAAGEAARNSLQDPGLREIALRVRAQVHGMPALVEDILGHARGRLSGGIPLRLQQVGNLGVRLNHTVGTALRAHPGRSILSHILVEQPIHCDGERIQQLTYHLLSNALVHGAPDGAVNFIAYVENSNLVLEVRNDGKVIAPDAIKKLFTPFPGRGADRWKAGQGLHICSEIVRAHLGRIRAQSTLCGGTTFIARIPVENH